MPLTMKTATIPAGQSLSGAIDCTAGNTGMRRLIMPSEWTEAWLTFTSSNDGQLYYDVYQIDGHPLVVTVKPGAMVLILQDLLQRGYWKLQSGTTETPVPQEADRVFTYALD